MNILSQIPHIAFLIKSFLAVQKYAAPIDAARQSGDTEAERKHIREAEKNWSDMLIEKFETAINVVGKENMPESGPVVFVSNHQSYIDIVAMFHIVPFQLGFISKKENSKIPKLNDYILKTRGLFIERDDVRDTLRMINEGAEYLKQGFSLCIFPEGTRSKGPEMGEMKAGSLKLATKAGVPIVPITISGAYRFFEEKNRIVKGTSFDVTIHPLIDVSTLSREELKALPEKVENIIRSAL